MKFALCFAGLGKLISRQVKRFTKETRSKAGTEALFFRSLVQGLNYPGTSRFLRALCGDLASTGLYVPHFMCCGLRNFLGFFQIVLPAPSECQGSDLSPAHHIPIAVTQQQ